MYVCHRLSRVTRLLLHELGSALVQNLFYRGSWYMVSQKGITGFSPFEEVSCVELEALEMVCVSEGGGFCQLGHSFMSVWVKQGKETLSITNSQFW
ncbi:FAM3A [Cordylochernes scorpioides]|uniref:FAM3A n=1 Tax=Cordylochernes scorpioides TaxID=51811 RepID=A0ABY6KCW1_9ARAC|nr:FAM3A [Cordylochernes scorpioides]